MWTQQGNCDYSGHWAPTEVTEKEMMRAPDTLFNANGDPQGGEGAELAKDGQTEAGCPHFFLAADPGHLWAARFQALWPSWG